MLELAALGESMVMVSPQAGAHLGSSPTYLLHVGGAESNVAMYAASLGHRAKWLSRVGIGPLGDFVTDQIAAAGVDVSEVERDEQRPTGVYFKDPGDEGTKVWYYRGGSAAAAMNQHMHNSLRAMPPRVLHLSGVTPALSESCLDLMRHLVLERPLESTRISFDVNYRPALDTEGTLPQALLELARAADIVFVGLDEAEIWGCSRAEQLPEMLGAGREIIVKDGARDARWFSGDTVALAPAPKVDVVEAVGAGDAFAAGWLSGWLRGLRPEDRLRLGHRIAAAALSSTGDYVNLPAPQVIRDELDISSSAWDGQLKELVKD